MQTLPPITPPTTAARKMKVLGQEITLHLSSADTGGGSYVFETLTPPGLGVPPHVHQHEDELICVLEGEFEVFLDGRTFRLAAGTASYFPRRIAHGFTNVGETIGRTLFLVTPAANFERFFVELGGFPPELPPDREKVTDIFARYNIDLVPPATDASKNGVAVPSIEMPPITRAFGDEVTWLLTGRQTGDAVTTFIDVTPPAGGPPPHYHEREDEWFFVLEGRVSFLLDGKWAEVTPGTTVFAPRKSVHAFKNVGTAPSRILIHTSPSGFENFFNAAAMEFAKPEGPDMARAVQIAAEHGIHFVAE